MTDRIITVHVKTKARSRSVESMPDDTYKVRTNVVPEKGKANEDVIALLADHLGVAKSCITLVSGASSPTKRFRITA